MQWTAVKTIVDRIDGAADTLKTPGYTRLVEDDQRPFKFADVQRLITFYQAFDVDQNGAIQVRYLATDAYGTNTWEPSDPVLRRMAENEDLFFVAEEDGCLCETLFKVMDEGGILTLAEAEQKGCCQTLYVPENGDTLPQGQNIIPTRPTASYIRNGNPMEGQRDYDGDKCRAEAGGVGFRFATTAAESQLQTTARQFTGYLTWPARADYMAEMWAKIELILSCWRNGGSNPDTWWTGSEYRQTECSPDVVEILRTMDHEGDIAADPGCLYEGNEVVYPWDNVTCGGESCEGDPKFYCETLLQMEALIDKIEGGVRPHTRPVGCCCTVASEGGTVEGESTICAAWVSDTITEPPNPKCWVISLVLTTNCSWMERSGPGEPFDIPKSNTTTYTRTYSGEVVKISEAGIACLLGSESENTTGDPLPPSASDYEDLECNTVVTTHEATDAPTEGDLIQKAKEDAVDNGGPANSVQSVGVGNWISYFGTMTPCYPGNGYAYLGKYTIVVNPPAGYEFCSGSPRPVNVNYDLVKYVSGVEQQRIGRSITCYWNSGSTRFESSPQNYPDGGNTPHGWAIEFDADGWYGSGAEILCIDCDPE